MNEIDVDPNLEARLRETMQAVARTTPTTITPHDTRPPSPTFRRSAMGIAAAVVLITGGAGLVMVQRRTTGSTSTVVTTLAPASSVEPAPAPSAPTATVEDPPSSISSMLPTEPATGVTQVANHGDLLDWVGTYTLVEGPARITVPTDNGLPFVIEKTDTTLCFNGTACGGPGRAKLRSDHKPSTRVQYSMKPSQVTTETRCTSGSFPPASRSDSLMPPVRPSARQKRHPPRDWRTQPFGHVETRSPIEVDGITILFAKEGETHSMTYRSDGYEFD